MEGQTDKMVQIQIDGGTDRQDGTNKDRWRDRHQDGTNKDRWRDRQTRWYK